MKVYLAEEPPIQSLKFFPISLVFIDLFAVKQSLTYVIILLAQGQSRQARQNPDYNEENMNNSDGLLNGIRLSLRQGNEDGLRLHLARILKKAKEPECHSRLRTEIYLEAIKAFRALDKNREAVELCEHSIANIPSDCFDLLSGLKRVRSLLYLDRGDLSAARTLIDETDGLEIVLQGGQSVINRHDTEVTVETWLISMEIAIAQNDLRAAQEYFERAIVRLSSEEAELRRKRVAFYEKRKLEQYYHDLGQFLNFYGLTLGLLTGDQEAPNSLKELFQTIHQENEAAAANKKLPNIPLESKIFCLLGRWSGLEKPRGISSAEAERWKLFGSPERFLEAGQNQEQTAVPDNSQTWALVSVPEQMPVASVSDSDLLAVTVGLLERMTNQFERVNGVLPDFMNYLKGEPKVDYTERQFGGHLLETDLFNLLYNIRKLNFTGYISFNWDSKLFESAILKGYLPDIVRVGEAVLYAVEGYIIDAVFKGQNLVNNSGTAQENFLLLTRMCFSIQTDDTPPNIIAKSKRDDAVAARHPLLKISDKDLFHITADLDEAVAGIEKDDGEKDFFQAQQEREVKQIETENTSDDLTQIENPPQPLMIEKPSITDELMADNIETDDELLELELEVLT